MVLGGDPGVVQPTQDEESQNPTGALPSHLPYGLGSARIAQKRAVALRKQVHARWRRKLFSADDDQCLFF